MEILIGAPETRTLKQIQRDYSLSQREYDRARRAARRSLLPPLHQRLISGIAITFGILIGGTLIAAVLNGIVGAIGLVPFLLLCLLFQGAGRRA